MMNENILELAKMSFEGGNYEDAFNKYSSLVESDITNKEFWIKRGLSCGYLSNYDNNRLQESITYLKKAASLSLTVQEQEFIAEEILKIADKHIDKVIKKLESDLDNVRKEPYASGELYATRNIKVVAQRMKSNRELYETSLQALDYAQRFNELKNSVENQKKYLTILDKYLTSLEGNLNPENLAKLQDRRAWLINKIQEIDTTFLPPPPKSDGGCFIATEVYTDYNHPKVLILRKFRDSVLLRSNMGKNFVKFYYDISPQFAQYLSSHENMKKIIKYAFLEPIILLVKKIFCYNR